MGGAEGSEGLEGKGQQLPDHAKKRASELSSEGQAGCFERFYLFIFRQRGREGEREGERHQCDREKHQSVASHMCPNWEEPTTQVYVPTRN